MEQDDTIVAISTPPGMGGIAVIRVSGPEAIPLTQKVFQGGRDLTKSEGYRAYHGWIMDGDEPIDEVVLTIFRGPNSYTGEDVVEVNCHGGIFVSQRIVELLIAHGACPARPGAFTQRGFIHGKLDLCQAEAVADLIQARTEASRKVAAYQLEGRLSERLKEMRERLIEACSLLEIELDFGEEDIEFVSRKDLIGMLCSLKEEMTAILASYDRGKVCREGIRMVIAGRPNVGKSSILNSLVERERAIVTDIPGTTRDTVEDVLDMEGLLFIITDTAGIRAAQDPVEEFGVQRAKQALETADLILLIFDWSESLTEEDETLIQLAENTKKKIIAIINKIDLSKKIDVQTLKKWIPKVPMIKVSALKQKGFPALIGTLEKSVLANGIPHAGEVVLTRIRHRESLNGAIRGIERAQDSLRSGMSQEFVVVDLRVALDALGEITGQATTADILDRIFSEFCIGK